MSQRSPSLHCVTNDLITYSDTPPGSFPFEGLSPLRVEDWYTFDDKKYTHSVYPTDRIGAFEFWVSCCITEQELSR